ncbi:MAG: hypothetical protein IJR39_01830 [Treponema sp.]|nr:hypothetical protein [Treponema sp.]
MKSTFIKFSKIALFLVCFGFFMPVSCDMNGVDLIRLFNKMQMTKETILLLLVILSVILSIIISFIFLHHLEDESITVDWILLITSIMSGILSIGKMSREYFKLQSGAYMIIIGWSFSLIFLIFASFSEKKKKYSDDDGDKFDFENKKDNSMF